MKGYIFLLFVLIGIQIKSQNSSSLSYDTYLTNVLKNNPMVKRADNEKQYGDIQYKAARGNYDPVINGSYDQKQFNGNNYFTTLNTEVKQPILLKGYLI